MKNIYLNYLNLKSILFVFLFLLSSCKINSTIYMLRKEQNETTEKTQLIQSTYNLNLWKINNKNLLISKYIRDLSKLCKVQNLNSISEIELLIKKYSKSELLCSAINNYINIWKYNGDYIKNFKAYNNEPIENIFAINENIILTQSKKNKFKIWNLGLGKKINTIKINEQNIIPKILGNQVLTLATSIGEIQIYDLKKGLKIKHFRKGKKITHFDILDTSKIVLAIKKNIEIWDTNWNNYIEPEKLKEFINFHDYNITRVHTFEKRNCISGDTEGCLKVWSSSNGKILKNLERLHNNSICSLDNSNEYIFSASLDGYVKICKKSNFSLLYSFNITKYDKNFDGYIFDVKYTSGFYFVTSDKKNGITIFWDFLEGMPQKTYKNNKGICCFISNMDYLYKPKELLNNKNRILKINIKKTGNKKLNFEKEEQEIKSSDNESVENDLIIVSSKKKNCCRCKNQCCVIL